MSSVPDALTDLRERVLPFAPQIAAGQIERLRARAAELGVDAGDDVLWRALEAGLAANIPLFFAGLIDGGRPPERFSPPTARLAHVAAARAVPVERLLLVVRAGQAQAWNVWRELVAALDLDDAGRGALSDLLLSYNFAWFDALSSALIAAYRQQPRRVAVQRALDGADVDLGYDLSLTHVGVIAWGAPLAAVRDALGAVPHAGFLAVDADDAVWVWLGTVRADPGLARTLARLELPDGARLAHGDAATGPAGFRATHAQALAARAVAEPDQPVTAYRDVAVVALALRDEAAARAFAAGELAPLGDGERGERARATLRALFAAGSASGAGALLGLSDRAVAYRVRAVEEALGAAVHERRTELDLALRVEAALALRPTR